MKAAFILLLSSIVSAFSISNLNAEDDHYIKSICKVSHSLGAGSGVVVDQNEDYFYILTASHVIINKPDPTIGLRNNVAKNLRVSFFRGNKMSREYKASVVWWHFDWYKLEDAAILAVEKHQVEEKHMPEPWQLSKDVIKIAKDVIESIGLPGGRWPMRWIGEIIDVSEEDQEFLINFNAIPGQSGSPLMQNNQIIGIILRTDGAGCDVNCIRDLIKRDNEVLYTQIFTDENRAHKDIISGSRYAEPLDVTE